MAFLTRVQAESLYEAVALAVAEFRQDRLVPSPSLTTEFTVAIERPAVEHRIRLNQVAKWAESTTKEGPAGMTKRQRVKGLISGTSVSSLGAPAPFVRTPVPCSIYNVMMSQRRDITALRNRSIAPSENYVT